jgi:ABC-type sugar transport system, permease component
MFVTSFLPETVAISWPPKMLPYPFTIDNYREILANTVDTPVLRWFLNSLIVAAGYSLLAILVASTAAYALSRLNFPGKNIYFGMLVGSMVVPGVIFLIPNYLTVNYIGWTDTYFALMIPGLAGVIGVFLLRQFFLGIPVSLEEAARIDGAGRFRIFVQIILPLSKPALITLLLMNFISCWNDYLWPLIVTYSPEMRTVPVGILTLQGRYVSYYGKLMAGAFLAAFPAMILFLLVQRYMIKGIVMSGVKG